MREIKSKFNLMSIVFFIVFSVILLFPFDVVNASTSPEEIQKKIDSMTNSVPGEPATPLLETYSPGDDTSYEKENDTDTLEIEEASDPELKSGKNAKRYMSPYKMILIIFVIDLLLLCGYFLYFNKKTGSKIQ